MTLTQHDHKGVEHHRATYRRKRDVQHYLAAYDRVRSAQSQQLRQALPVGYHWRALTWANLGMWGGSGLWETASFRDAESWNSAQLTEEMPLCRMQLGVSAA